MADPEPRTLPVWLRWSLPSWEGAQWLTYCEHAHQVDLLRQRARLQALQRHWRLALRVSPGKESSDV